MLLQFATAHIWGILELSSLPVCRVNGISQCLNLVVFSWTPVNVLYVPSASNSIFSHAKLYSYCFFCILILVCSNDCCSANYRSLACGRLTGVTRLLTFLISTCLIWVYLNYYLWIYKKKKIFEYWYKLFLQSFISRMSQKMDDCPMNLIPSYWPYFVFCDCFGQLLKLMYNVPVTAGYHQSVWTKIGRTVDPLVHRYAPFLNKPISVVRRWWLR